MKSNKFLLTLAFAAALTGCINDADVTTEGGTSPVPEVRGGNLEISFAVPNSSNGSRAATVEDSGIYQQGTAAEYQVNNVTLYLFDSSNKNLVETIYIDKTDLEQTQPSGAESQEGKTILYPCKKEITIKPGTYDILAIANGTQTFNGGPKSTLLAQIDGSTYGDGLIKSIPENGFIMSNRGSANLDITVQSPEKSD